jgi:hypothetical protein
MQECEGGWGRLALRGLGLLGGGERRLRRGELRRRLRGRQVTHNELKALQVPRGRSDRWVTVRGVEGGVEAMGDDQAPRVQIMVQREPGRDVGEGRAEGKELGGCTRGQLRLRHVRAPPLLSIGQRGLLLGVKRQCVAEVKLTRKGS